MKRPQLTVRPTYFIALLASVLWFSQSVQAIDQALLMNLLQLKQESYLSKKGELFLDIIPTYSQDESIVPWSITKFASYGFGLNFRLGLTNRLEAALKLPYSSSFKSVYTSKWDSSSCSGLSDPSLSFRYELQTESFEKPSVYLSLTGTLPLSYNLGWSFLKSIDPVVVYGGLDYQLNLGRDSYKPGDQIIYNGGLSFALNQQISLSLGLAGAYVTCDRNVVNGVDQPVSSAYNRVGLNLGPTFVISPDLTINPNIFYGLTKEETDFVFSFSLTRRLKEAS